MKSLLRCEMVNGECLIMDAATVEISFLQSVLKHRFYILHLSSALANPIE